LQTKIHTCSTSSGSAWIHTPIVVTYVRMSSIKFWHFHQWRLWGKLGLFPRGVTSSRMNPLSRSYITKEPTLSLVFLYKTWLEINIMFLLFQLQDQKHWCDVIMEGFTLWMLPISIHLYYWERSTVEHKHWNYPVFKNNCPKPPSSRWYIRTSSILQVIENDWQNTDIAKKSNLKGVELSIILL
jgi:hypothetical protein